MTLSRRQVVAAPGAPAAIGPYSQAIAYQGVLYCSGVLPLDSSGEIIDPEPAAQVDTCLRSLSAIARAAGAELGAALRVTIYTTRLDLFDEINQAYAAWFDVDPPARVALGAAELPRGPLIEIDAMVALTS